MATTSKRGMDATSSSKTSSKERGKENEKGIGLKRPVPFFIEFNIKYPYIILTEERGTWIMMKNI